jgi:hypothetical protein
MTETGANWWMYSKWINNIARNARISNPEDPLLSAIRTLLKGFWNPVTQTGTRPWLDNKFRRLASSGATGYAGNIDVEPASVLVEMLSYAGRDLKKIPITSDEKVACDIVLALDDNRHLGTGPYFGGVSGEQATRVDPVPT